QYGSTLETETAAVDSCALGLCIAGENRMRNWPDAPDRALCGALRNQRPDRLVPRQSCRLAGSRGQGHTYAATRVSIGFRLRGVEAHWLSLMGRSYPSRSEAN